jgi:hypothetical protein
LRERERERERESERRGRQHIGATGRSGVEELEEAPAAEEAAAWRSRRADGRGWIMGRQQR